MAVRTTVTIPRPDHTEGITGSQGDLTDQEPGTGKSIIRRGAGESNADIDVGTASSARDLIADGDFDSGAKNAGGAEALAGKFISDDSNTFSVFVDWLNDDDETVITSNPAALTDVTDVEFNLIMRSDRFKLRVEDTSAAGQNNVHGSANAH